MTAAPFDLDVAGPAAPPRSNGELVFAEPWESRAFGLAVSLSADGVFEWEEFRQALIAAIARFEREGTGEWSYWACWLEALESVVERAGLVTPAVLEGRARDLARRPAGHGHDHRRGHDQGASGA